MSKNNTENERPELPSGWEWWSGNRAETYLTINFGTEYDMGGPLAGDYGMGGFMGQVTWDEGRDYLVEILPVSCFDGDDPVYGYSVEAAEFETEEEAIEAVPEMIESL